MLLCENGKCLGAIFVSESDYKANLTVMYAAKELRYYIGRMTACPIEIKVGDGSEKNAIILGEISGVNLSSPCDDGFIISSTKDSVNINGGNRGIIYGAYELLEKLGCRFFTRLCEKIPTYRVLDIPEFETEQKPAFEYRHHNYADVVQYPGFAVKSRFNGSYIDDNMGGYMSYAWFVHTFESLVPTSVYGETHPEYFALVDGKRCTRDGGRTQLCLTNPDVLKISIEAARKKLKENPKCRLISISQNDWGGNCQCENCRRIDEEEGSASGSLLRFVNSVAEALEPEFPDVIFDTLAYMYSRPAPKYVKNRHNVCVRLCSIECCFAHSFEKCDDESRSVKRPDGTVSRFITDLRDWGKTCDRVYIWDYTTCFAHYPTPHPNWRVLQPNVQAMRDNNVKGVFEQANGASRGGVDFNEMRCYLISKLLWNPDCDLEAHRKEYMEYVYGAAAPYLDEYLNMVCDICEEKDIHVGFNDNPVKEFCSEEYLAEYSKLFDKAAEAVKGDALRLQRVEKARLSIRWVALKRKTMFEGILAPDEINNFFEDWKEHGMSRIDEWCNVNTTHRALLDRKWRGVEYLEHWTGEEKEIL